MSRFSYICKVKILQFADEITQDCLIIIYMSTIKFFTNFALWIPLVVNY